MSFDDIFNSNIGMLDLLTPTISVASTASGVTVSITDKNGLKQYTLTNGVHVSSANINGNGELVLTLSDGQTINAGNAKGANGTNGTNGVSITNVQVNALGHLVCTLSNGQTIDAGSTVGETAVSSVNGKTGTVVLTASDVGAATASDIATAVSSKQDTINDLSTIRSGASAGATALQASAKGTANGVAELDANGKVPSAQLPSFVDDVLEYENASSFPATGETGKIYVAKNTNKTYRWSGSEYVAIADGVALGETSSTAYRGDRGKTAYDHSQVTTGNPHNVSKTDVGLGNVDNTSDLDKPISTATQTALNGYVKSDASSRQTVSLNGAVPFAVRNKTAGHHRVYQSFETFADNSLGYIGVDNGTPKFLESDGTTEHVFAFSSDIPDMSSYRTSSAQDVIDNGKANTTDVEMRSVTLTAWNQDILNGSITPSVTLPTPSGTKAESITYMFTAASANASFTAPANWKLCKDAGTSGLSTGNTLSFTDLTVGSIYEVSFKPISSSVIRLLMCETKTA